MPIAFKLEIIEITCNDLNLFCLYIFNLLYFFKKSLKRGVRPSFIPSQPELFKLRARDPRRQHCVATLHAVMSGDVTNYTTTSLPLQTAFESQRT